LLNVDFEEYNPTRYKLTDKEGMVYVINQATGLEKITDLNGNTITFGPNGIVHSAERGDGERGDVAWLLRFWVCKHLLPIPRFLPPSAGCFINRRRA
jgi:hypothetical protein